MRAALALIALVACSKPKPTTVDQPANTGQPEAATSGQPGQLIVEDAISISVFRPTDFPHLMVLDQSPDVLECWRELENKLEIAYQVFAGPGASYVILVGDLPRERVESCASEWLLYNRMLNGELRRDGDLTVMPTTAGTVYAAWHGRHVVLGRRADVQHALAARSLPPWVRADDLPTPASFETTALVTVSTEPTFAGLLGVPTTRWKLVMESPRQPWPERRIVKDGADALEQFAEEQRRAVLRKEQGLPPQDTSAPAANPPAAWFRGRLELTYASPEDARRAEEALAKGAFTVPLEANLAAALAKLPQTLTGATLAVRFDKDSFHGIELGKLQAWAASLQRAP